MDPFTIATIIGSIAGGIGNIFGSRVNKRKFTATDLINAGYKPMDTTALKTEVSTNANNMINERRDTINEKYIGSGYDPAGAIGAYDKDISNNAFNSYLKIDQAKENEDRRVNDYLMKLNLNEEEKKANEEDPFSAFLGGGIKTFNTITSFKNALGNKPDASNITIDDLINFLKIR